MASTIKQLIERGFLNNVPAFIPDNIHYETMMGSVAYGVSSDTSDCDVYGFCIPPKNMIFPHLDGEIPDFGRQKKRFHQYQEHHVDDPDALAGKGKQYDFSMYNIVKYFSLCMENNPNMIDSLFTPQFCVLHITHIGNMVRENRKMFLHKGSWHKFKGYAYSQLHKMRTKDPKGKRLELREKFGFDVKFAYHVVRLLYEAEQILLEGDIDLQRHREHLKEIRRGEIPEAEIRRWASEKEKQLEQLYVDSKLQYSPDESKIKQLLLNCLEHHYGKMENCVIEPDLAAQYMDRVAELVQEYQRVANATIVRDEVEIQEEGLSPDA